MYTKPAPLKQYLLTYLLIPCSTVRLEKLTGLQLVKKFPAFYRTWRFITAFTSACQLSLSWASPLPHLSYMPCPSHSSQFYHLHNGGWGVQIMELLIMKFSPFPCYLRPWSNTVIKHTATGILTVDILWVDTIMLPDGKYNWKKKRERILNMWEQESQAVQWKKKTDGPNC
jgi:hypothetical protein